MQQTIELQKVRVDTNDYGLRSVGKTHGLVFTKNQVVTSILDIVGYSEKLDLKKYKIVEPSCGHGVFVIEIVKRILKSCRNFERKIEEFDNALLAIDLDTEAVFKTRKLVLELLLDNGVSNTVAKRLVFKWIKQADFLQYAIKNQSVDFVVGNPPYIRIEQIPKEAQNLYKQMFETLAGRADLYVAFIEKGLNLLKKGGSLSYICADRWIQNSYGSRLRSFISSGYNLHMYVDLNDLQPFEEDVSAYPSIFVIKHEKQRQSVPVYKLLSVEKSAFDELRSLHFKESQKSQAVLKTKYEKWFEGNEPWLISFDKRVRDLREEIENKFLKLEDTGAKVGIGIATGKDDVYIFDTRPEIEDDRLVPLVKRENCIDSRIIGKKYYVINTFSEDNVVDLDKYPLLSKYFEKHKSVISKRHVAKKNPKNWFRTIDKIDVDLIKKPKLLIPDIAKSCLVTYDEGHFYPHHNLYYVTSDEWDLEVLGGILSSRLVEILVRSYSVTMRGGYSRFQAQNLRRVRLPAFNSIDKKIVNKMKQAFVTQNKKMIDQLTCQIYSLDPELVQSIST